MAGHVGAATAKVQLPQHYPTHPQNSSKGDVTVNLQKMKSGEVVVQYQATYQPSGNFKCPKIINGKPLFFKEVDAKVFPRDKLQFGDSVCYSIKQNSAPQKTKSHGFSDGTPQMNLAKTISGNKGTAATAHNGPASMHHLQKPKGGIPPLLKKWAVSQGFEKPPVAKHHKPSKFGHSPAPIQSGKVKSAAVAKHHKPSDPKSIPQVKEMVKLGTVGTKITKGTEGDDFKEKCVSTFKYQTKDGRIVNETRTWVLRKAPGDPAQTHSANLRNNIPPKKEMLLKKSTEEDVPGKRSFRGEYQTQDGQLVTEERIFSVEGNFVA